MDDVAISSRLTVCYLVPFRAHFRCPFRCGGECRV